MEKALANDEFDAPRRAEPVSLREGAMFPIRFSIAARFLAVLAVAIIISGAITSASAQRKRPSHDGGGGYEGSDIGGGGGGRGRDRPRHRSRKRGGGNVGNFLLRIAPQVIDRLDQYDDDDDDDRPRRRKRVRSYDDVYDDDDDRPRKVRRRPSRPKADPPPRRLTAVPPLPVIPPERFTPPAPASTPPSPFRRAVTIAERPQFKAAEILLLIRGDDPDTVAAGIAQGFNLALTETLSFALLETSRVYRFSILDNQPVPTVVAAVSTVPGVGLAAPNTYYFLEGDAGSAALGLQYALPKMRVPAAQTIANGKGLTVAVIDSGVDRSHPALKDANLTLLDIVKGGVEGPDMHGTAVTGIIAASGDLTGIAPGAKVIAVRAFAPERLGSPAVTTTDALMKAVDQAFSLGARIFNMSFAGQRNEFLIELIDAAYAKGAVFVAAAGNEGPDAPPAYPAAHDKVIAITATDEADALYDRANRGGYVFAAAPGVDILAPVMDQGFDYLSGTSFAAAHVTGVIALMMERNPQLTAEAVRSALVDTAQDLGDVGRDTDFGAGLTDAYGALMLVSKDSGIEVKGASQLLEKTDVKTER
jgi:subtilisin family serine protease